MTRVGYIYSIDNDPAGISITLDNALSISYYDDYNFDKPSNEIPSGYASQPKGLVTGKRSRVLGTSNWIREVVYYDNEYRVLQTIRDLYDIPGSSSPTEWVTVQYNSGYLNRIDRETIQHKGLSNSTTNTIEKGYCYDHALRLKKTSLKLNALPEVTLNYFTYNDLGQVAKKGVGKKGGAGFADETEYRYHIQGMVARINSAKFKQELYYEKKKNNSDGFYNGLIAEMYWENGSGGLKNYAYEYDKAGSLTSATSSNFRYEEKGITYDANGNIKTLQRTWDGTAPVDNLIYSYTNNNSSNQLASINDQTGNNTGYKGGSHSYEYDANGNLTKDGSRGITTAMGYNVLNLVETVSVNGKNLRYTYSASGEKLKYEVVGTSDKTVYASIGEYGNTGYLTRIHTDEGFITFNQSNSTFHFFYCLTDHLGNIRRVIDENGNPVQTNEYLALGAVVSSDASPYSGKNRYFYQGKELQPEQTWYDFHTRMYDPMTGRFNQIDPITNFPVTGYAGMLNNPVSYIDPDGQEPVTIILATIVIGGGLNLWSNWSKVKNLETGLAYFASGAVGGVVSILATPYAGGGVTAGGNVLIDIATGNIPNFEDPLEVSRYGLGVAFDGLGAGTAGSMAKGFARTGLLGIEAMEFAGRESMKYAFSGTIQTLSRTEMATLAREGIFPSTNIAAGVKRVTQFGNAFVGSAGAKAIKNGSTIANRLGQQMHKSYKAGDVLDGIRIKEF